MRELFSSLLQLLDHQRMQSHLAIELQHQYPSVQIDEFYPMNPEHKNSFAHYIKKFYFDGFGLDPKKALLMDTWKIGAPSGKNLGWVFPEDKVDISLFCFLNSRKYSTLYL